jgi:hypothetical protein
MFRRVMVSVGFKVALLAVVAVFRFARRVSSSAVAAS